MVRTATRLEIAKQAVVAAVAEQDRLQEEHNIGSASLEELNKEASATPPPMEVDSSATSKRAGEVVADPTVLVPEALEELPQWITSTFARMSMAMEREDLA